MDRAKGDGLSGIHGAGPAHFNDRVHVLPPGQGNAVQDALPGGGTMPAILHHSGGAVLQMSGDPLIDAVVFYGTAPVYQKDLSVPAKFRELVHGVRAEDKADGIVILKVHKRPPFQVKSEQRLNSRHWAYSSCRCARVFSANAQIIQQEQRYGPLKVEENELGPQQQITPQILEEKRPNAIENHQRGGSPQCQSYGTGYQTSPANLPDGA